jgi:hypothetical protein
MGKSVLMITGIVIILLVVVLVWGFMTNWGKSFDGSGATQYCYNACVDLDRDKYCTRNLIVDFDGSTWRNTNCNTLSMNEVTGLCEEIKCP